MPALRFKTCRLLPGNVWNKILVVLAIIFFILLYLLAGLVLWCLCPDMELLLDLTSGLGAWIHQLVYQLVEFLKGSQQGREPMPLGGGLGQEPVPPTGRGRGDMNAPVPMLQPGDPEGPGQLPDLNDPAPGVAPEPEVASEEERQAAITKVAKQFAYLWGADSKAEKDEMFPRWELQGGGGFIREPAKIFLDARYEGLSPEELDRRVKDVKDWKSGSTEYQDFRRFLRDMPEEEKERIRKSKYRRS